MTQCKLVYFFKYANHMARQLITHQYRWLSKLIESGTGLDSLALNHTQRSPGTVLVAHQLQILYFNHEFK